ncbi:DUF2339 domain-containing protein [Gordonia sp. (in: high G+C Gram-positive bacteria)]|uniref:DUF2339 domain-containing protein n=1 Tax=Gordonia sp. (in: high G+C Gram-positive bacteria) TaxID=84139 RepID=UPI003C73EB3D
MNNNSDPAVAAARLGDELSSIAGRMSTLSSDFAELSASLGKPVTVTAPQPQPRPNPQPQLQYATATPFGRPPVQPYNPQTVYPQTAAPQQHVGYPLHPGARQFVPPQPPAPKRSFSERISDAAERGLVGRILAAVGVGITLIGVILLLVLAAQAGLLRPEVRVAGGALFAAALVGIGVRIGRREEKRSGAVALVATGVAAALFDVLAATTIYHWLPEIAAIVLGAAIGAAGLAVAHRWNSQTLGLMVSIPLLIFAPVAAGGVDEVLVSFMLAYAASTLWLQMGRDWTALFVVNTVAATLPLFAYLNSSEPLAWFAAVAALINLAMALGSTMLLAPSSSRSTLLGVTAVFAGLPVAMLGSLDSISRHTGAAIVAIAAVAFIAAALISRGQTKISYGCRVLWLSAGALFLALAMGAALDASMMPLGLLVAAMVVLIAARWSDDLELPVRIIGTVFVSIGLLALLAVGGVNQLLILGSLNTSQQATLLIGALVGLATVTLATRDWGETASSKQQLWLVGGLIDLWLITELCVSVGNLVTGGSDGGFRGGHLAATLVWFGSAAAALLWARTLAGSARSLTLATGLAIITAAVAKLFLFDLAALSGIYRVIAFIVAGLVLLSLGVAYAQRLTSDEPAAQ